jgi:hypothetical protein
MTELEEDPPLADAQSPPEDKMEVHAPDQPVHSVKSFLVHLSIVTAGILIALALENAVEWLHHRSLAREAEANITEEITENLGRLEHFSESAEKFAAELKKAVQNVEKLVDEPRQPRHWDISLNLKLTALSTAAWQTAGAMGALGYMSYGQVRRYADVYDLQRHFDEAQKETLRDFGPAMAMLKFVSSKKDPRPGDVDALRDRLIALQAAMWMQQGLATETKTLYTQTVGSRRPDANKVASKPAESGTK